MQNLNHYSFDYLIDYVICLDASCKSSLLIEDLKKTAETFLDQFKEGMESIAMAFHSLRVKVVLFRDDDCGEKQIEESPFFTLYSSYKDNPDQCKEFVRFVRSIRSDGETTGKNALFALAAALRSDWVKAPGVRRHVVHFFNCTTPAEMREWENCHDYPAEKPAILTDLENYWEKTMEGRTRRLTIFAPESASSEFFYPLTNTIFVPTDPRASLADLDFKTILHFLVQQL